MSVKSSMVDLIVDVYQLSSSNLTSTLTNYITFDLSSTPAKGVYSLWGFAKQACDSIFMPIATGLLIFFFLFELCSQSTNENFNLQQFYKLMAKFVITMFLIQNGFVIFTTFVNLGYGLMNTSLSKFAVGDKSTIAASAEIFRNILNGQSLIPLLLIAVMVVIISIAGQFIKLIASMICITRLFNIVIMTAGMPLGIVDVYHGMSSNGMRFFKSFAAVCIQGVVMLLILQVSNIMSYIFMPSLATEATLMQALGFCMDGLLVQLTTVTLLQKSLQITKEFLGV